MSEQAIEFIKTVFGPTTEAPVFVCSLGNERDGPHAPRQVATRDMADITKFIAKWDQRDRGMFFCVGTVQAGKKREKANIAEIALVHADIDFKDIETPRDEVLAILRGLEIPPSILIRSGNGVHAYWLLKEGLDAQTEGERVEAAMRLLADTVGGDNAPAHIAGLMRMPGSHNSKRGSWVEVTTELLTDRRYELDDLEEWLTRTAPKIQRKAKPATVIADDNPFLTAARQLGFKPSIDVEQRLNAMTFGGAGDSAVHTTQLSVSASMLAKGAERNEVVATIMAATVRAASAYGVKWNWRREERAIEQMCDTWLRKHGSPAPRSLSAAAVRRDEPDDNVVSIGSAAAARKPKPAKSNVSVHIVLGEAVIAAIRYRGDDLMFTPKAAWRYTQGLWSLEIDGLRAWLDMEIETACRELNVESTNKIISEARQWIVRNPTLWREDIKWDAHGKVPTRSGLIDPLTLAIIPSCPSHYATWRIECDYTPAAICPWWETMLNDFFGDRSEEQRADLARVVQECLGAAMVDTKPRALSKALILRGGSNFGKSGILEVLGGLFGDEQIATGLEALEGSHGLMAFTKRLPWVLHEAFDQGKWHFSSAVKAIITGEPVSINIKNGPMLSQRVKAPIFWGTNHPPQFKEATKAIINRMIVIECRREFIEGQPVGAAAEAFRRGFEKPSTLILETEMPGLLNWALVGLQTALKRQFIEVPDEVKDTADEIRRDSNLVAGFLEECIEFDRDRRVSTPDFCAAFAVWWLENKGEDRRVPSNEAVGKALSAMGDPRVAINPKELRETTRRYYAGIKLNEQGLALWKRANESKLFEGKVASTTPVDGQVNSLIPESWMKKTCIQAMRIRHSKNDNCHLSLKSSVTDDLSSATVTDDVSRGEATENSKQPRF